MLSSRQQHEAEHSQLKLLWALYLNPLRCSHELSLLGKGLQAVDACHNIDNKHYSQLPSSALVLALSSAPLVLQTQEHIARLYLMNMTMSLIHDALVHSATPPTDNREQQFHYTPGELKNSKFYTEAIARYSVIIYVNSQELVVMNKSRMQATYTKYLR
jgi:hypothetical protein